MPLARALTRALRGDLGGVGHPCAASGEDDLRVVRGAGFGGNAPLFVFSGGASEQIPEWICGG